MRRALLGLLALTTACVPTEFEDLRAEGQTRALAPPADYPNQGFGAVVTGYGGTLGDRFFSRVAGSAGADTPFTVYPLVVADRIRLDVPVIDGCDEEVPCSPGAGVSLVGMPGWADRELCIAVTAPESGEIRFRCEDNVTQTLTIGGPGGERFGVAGAGLRAEHPFGRAVYGAPGSSTVYRLPDGAAPIAVDLSAGAGVGRELGRAVAVEIIDAERVLLAAAAPVGAAKRVIVASSAVTADGTVATSVHGCLDSGSDGWGEALAIADLNGDGVLDVAVGSGAGPTRLNVVRVYDGAAMPAADTCDASWTPAIELGCPARDGVECEGSGFGSALAVGDLDADGTSELLVGAPAARVDDIDGAGAAFVFRGGVLAALGEADRVAVLRHSAPTADAAMGSALAVAPGLDGRDEPVVGAPGLDRVYVFLCSGLDADSEPSTPAMQCQPR